MIRPLPATDYSNVLFHQVRDVELRYTAKSAGPVEELYACHVFGMAQPLGFAIKAKNRVRVELAVCYTPFGDSSVWSKPP